MVYCRVVSEYELIKQFYVYLNFILTCRINSSVHMRELDSRQEEIYELIKFPHDSEFGYRLNAKKLRDINIKTTRGNVFKDNNVFASHMLSSRIFF